MSILLKEGRKEDLKKKYINKFQDYPDTLDFVLGISDLADSNYKYTDFVLKNLHPNSSTDEIEDAVELVKDFEQFSNKLEIKDINQYKSFNQLQDVILKLKEVQLPKSQVEKIYEDDKFLVVKPKNEEASCKYGSNTKWCVTSKGSGHFGRYTAGRQSLYFIINKSKSTNKNYSKVAIHFDDEGTLRYWDAQDSPMSQREIDVFEYAFSEMIDTIKSDYKSSEGSTDKILTQVFNSLGRNAKEHQSYLNSNYNLSVLVRGFSNVSDLGFGRSEGYLTISLNPYKGEDTDDKLIDKYQMFITYKSKNEKTFIANVEFVDVDQVLGDNFTDLGLEGWGFESTYSFARNPEETAKSVRILIASRVLNHILTNSKLTQKVDGSSNVWNPNRSSYGYTFEKNKGLIKKLVDYLDTDAIGTKLDFLVSIGKLKSKIIDGKKYYSKNGDYLSSSNWRGYFSSFFASARLAGILNYRKIGRDYFLTKGPNFDAFKEGQLKSI
jgi:REP element-mobilizing transposase RayT